MTQECKRRPRLRRLRRLEIEFARTGEFETQPAERSGADRRYVHMAHIPKWRLTSLSADSDFEEALVTAVWQCVTCAVFVTKYSEPRPPRFTRHESSEEPDA